MVADIARTATVTASGQGLLLAVERDAFLLAVTGHGPAHEAAWKLLESMGHGHHRNTDAGEAAGD